MKNPDCGDTPSFALSFPMHSSLHFPFPPGLSSGQETGFKRLYASRPLLRHNAKFFLPASLRQPVSKQRLRKKNLSSFCPEKKQKKETDLIPRNPAFSPEREKREGFRTDQRLFFELTVREDNEITIDVRQEPVKFLRRSGYGKIPALREKIPVSWEMGKLAKEAQLCGSIPSGGKGREVEKILFFRRGRWKKEGIHFILSGIRNTAFSLLHGDCSR